MKQAIARRNKHPLESQPGTRRKIRWTRWVAGMVLLVVVVVAAMAVSRWTEAQGTGRLVGRWLRPDGGYVLDIRGARAGGELEVGYFNPRPIHVAQASYRKAKGDLAVFVELRDINYPGSTYSLRYLATEDRLVGEYFQALQQQTFDVEFVRSN